MILGFILKNPENSVNSENPDSNRKIGRKIG